MRNYREDAAVIIRNVSERRDASESIFTENQLKEIDTTLFSTKFPDILFRNFIPVKHINNGKSVYSYKMYTHYGVAKWISDYASDLPRAGVKAEEFFRKMASFAIAYGWSFQEMRAAAASKEPLEDEEARAARRAVEEFFEAVALSGDSNLGILGILNQVNTTLYTVPNGVSGSSKFKDKNPDEVLADLNGIANNIVASTSDVEKPDTLLLPTTQYTDIASRRIGDGSSGTILKQFLETNQYIKQVSSWWRLAGAGQGGSDRMIAYKRDPANIQMIIGQEFETFAAQIKNLTVVVPCHARTGGVVVRFPLSMSYGDGI